MSKYIDVESLRNNLPDDIQYKASVKRVLMQAPSADVVEVRHGRWVSNGLGGYKYAFYCSECGWVDGYPFSDRHKYCPGCGAKMDGERSENGKS